MNTLDNRHCSRDDIGLDELLNVLDAEPAAALVFRYDGGDIRPGYHVTEVKAGQFAALDCGANPESWTEIFVQLWDVDEDVRTHMNAGKFAAIVRKVSEHLALDGTARLTFEVSDGHRPIELYKAGQPVLANGVLHVTLSARAASCKPRDRWLAQDQQVQKPCCPPQSSSTCCA